MYAPQPLNWTEEMTTGDAELDSQHKYLIDFVNDLGRSIRKGHDPEDVTRVLKVMKYYAEWHFGKEEVCMLRFHCPVADKNQKAHAVFIEKMNRYQKEYETSGASSDLAMKIHQDLSDWIVNHIMVLDTQLHPCIQQEQGKG